VVARNRYYSTRVSFQNQANLTISGTYSDLTYSLLDGGVGGGAVLDDCGGWACNKACDFFGQCTHCGV